MSTQQPDVQKEAQLYWQLTQQGVPPAQAFQQAFPKGLPTQQDKLKEAAKGQQSAAIGQIGGLAAGALGSGAIINAVGGKAVFPGIFGKGGLFGVGGDTGAGTTTGSQLTGALTGGSGGSSAGAGGAVATSATGAYPVATSAEGGTIMSDGSIVGASGASEGASAAGAASATPGMFSLGGIGTAGNVILPAAGALGAYDLFSNKRHGGAGAGEGALSGAAIGSYGGPWGALAGALIGGGLGYFGNFGDRDRWKTDQDRFQKLQDAGVYSGPIQQLTKGRSTAELVGIENQKLSQGQYGNPLFAQTRNEGDLRDADTAGAAANYELLGKDYTDSGSTGAQRMAFQNQLLNEGLWREHYGTLDITDPNRAKAIWQGIVGGSPQQQPQAVPQQQIVPLNKQTVAAQGKFGNQLTQALAGK